MHEDPEVPNFGLPNTGPRLKPGMVICIEPMLTFGKRDVYVLEDDWTVVTQDNSPAAHYEHTLLVTEDGYDITFTFFSLTKNLLCCKLIIGDSYEKKYYILN